jgi:hypothetical protein
VRVTLIIGVVLVILGVIGLVYEGFTMTHQKKVLDIGPIQATKKMQETIPIPPAQDQLEVAVRQFAVALRLPVRSTRRLLNGERQRWTTAVPGLGS